MSYVYSENIHVQESAGNLLQELGWRVVFVFNEKILGDNGSLDRNFYCEVLLLREFTAQFCDCLFPKLMNNEIEV